MPVPIQDQALRNVDDTYMSDASTNYSDWEDGDSDDDLVGLVEEEDPLTLTQESFSSNHFETTTPYLRNLPAAREWPGCLRQHIYPPGWRKMGWAWGHDATADDLDGDPGYRDMNPG